MIKLNGNQRTVRECLAPFQYTGEDGELVNAEIRVRYFSLTIKEIKANQAKAATKSDEESAEWLSDQLAERIAELPDIQDEKGKKLQITPAVLENFDLVNLMSISKAIGEDLSPKVLPAKLPSG